MAGAGAAVGALIVLAVAAAAAGVAITAEHVDYRANADAIEAFRSELHASVLVPSTIEAGDTLAAKVYLHRPPAETTNEIAVTLVDRERLRRYTFVLPVTEAQP